MILIEENFNGVKPIQESVTREDGTKEKKLFMEGIFLQAEEKNRNGRIYKLEDIRRECEKANKLAEQQRYLLGQLGHPEGKLDPELDKIAIKVVETHVKGKYGYGKAEVLVNQPHGQILKGLLESNIQLGVSSRGTGRVNETAKGTMVEDFQWMAQDVVTTPSAQTAYPTSVYESLYMFKHGDEVEKLAEAVLHDQAAQKYFQKEMLKFIQHLSDK